MGRRARDRAVPGSRCLTARPTASPQRLLPRASPSTSLSARSLPNTSSKSTPAPRFLPSSRAAEFPMSASTRWHASTWNPAGRGERRAADGGARGRGADRGLVQGNARAGRGGNRRDAIPGRRAVALGADRPASPSRVEVPESCRVSRPSIPIVEDEAVVALDLMCSLCTSSAARSRRSRRAPTRRSPRSTRSGPTGCRWTCGCRGRSTASGPPRGSGRATPCR